MCVSYRKVFEGLYSPKCDCQGETIDYRCHKFILNTISHQIQHHNQHHILKYEKNSILLHFWATIDHKNIFTQDTSPLFQKQIFALHRRCFYKHLLFTKFLIVSLVDQVCYISNKHQPLNNLAKRQYF